MKEVKAYVRSSMVDGVVDALSQLPGVPGVSVVSTVGFGRDAEGRVSRVEMTKLEIDVRDEHLREVVGCIVGHARTGAGHPQDGKVLVSALETAVRIGDGARDEEALGP